jgi:WD40 repeat protein
VSTSSPNRVAALQGHKFGISCLCFSPNLRYLISVGYQHDQTINIWDWKQGTKIASNKITSKVYGIAYSEDGRYFVTVGSRRVRYWYFDTGQRSKATKLTLPLNGRSAILGEHQNNCFVAVKCGRGQLAKFTYVLTKSGLLCQFNQSRELEKFTDIKSGKASCLEIHSDYVMCGCNDGIIRLFDPITLDYITTAPRPHSLGVSLLSTLHLTEFISTPGHCPDTVALSYDIINNKVL